MSTDMEMFSDLEYLMEGIGMSGIDLLSNFGSTILGLVGYVLMAIGMYTIAKRRGIKNPWLAWIPFGSTWMLGCISDQYQYVVKREEKSKRKWMLGLEILTYGLVIASLVVLVVSLIKMFAGMDTSADMMLDEDVYMLEVLSPLFGSLGMIFLAIIPAIALTVLQYMALYDLFTSCEPNNKVLYLILSIFLSVAMPLFVFIVRNKDLGMPPRQPEFYQPAAWQPPVQPQNPPVWQPPVQPQDPPAWQPSEPPVEPWDNVTEE